MDSAKGARPLSSFCTICSSCSKAASKLSDFTSSCAFSAMFTLRKLDWSSSQQARHMLAHATRKASEVIPTFEQRDNAIGAPPLGNVHQFAREPGIIFVHPFKLRQGIAVMCVETGRDQQHVGRKILQRRQDRILISLAHRLSARMGGERDIDHIADAGLARMAG